MVRLPTAYGMVVAVRVVVHRHSIVAINEKQQVAVEQGILQWKAPANN